MRVDPRLSGYLSRALDHEMAAVQQYMSQALLCDMWGMSDAARQMQHEVEEELEHAQRIMRFMLARGLTPARTQLPPVRPGRSLQDMLLIDRELEIEAIHLYDEAARYSQRIRDQEALHLFAQLLQEEQQHLASLDGWLQELARQGVANG